MLSGSIVGIFAAVVLGQSALRSFNSGSTGDPSADPSPTPQPTDPPATPTPDPTVDPSPSPQPTPTATAAQTFSFEVVTVDETGDEIDRQTKSAEIFQEELGNGIMLDLVKIPVGEFMMGSSPEELDRDSDEGPQRLVTIAEPFWMGRYQVTQAQWRAVTNLPRVDRDLDSDPSWFKGDNRPVEQISWYDAVEFCWIVIIHRECMKSPDLFREYWQRYPNIKPDRGGG